MIKPMLASLADKPFDRKGWFFEVKWDGYRAIAEKHGKTIKLYSRNKTSFLEKFSEIAESIDKIDGDFVLDGEIVVLDNKGLPRFQLIQDYHRTHEGDLVYYVFDILELDGKNLQKLPLKDRKITLQRLLTKVPHIEFGDHVEDRGLDFFEAVKKRGIEGMVAKDGQSLYRQGERSSEWLKIKTRMRQEAVIGGYTSPRDSREYFGSLLLGIYEDGGLKYIGHSGGGFDEKDLKLLFGKLKGLKTDKCPFSDVPTETGVSWVKPELVCEIEFEEWTREGLMRQPVFVGLREDKDARKVTKEIPLDMTDKYFGQEAPKNEKDLQVKVKIGKRTLTVSHPNKIYWPNDGYTKGDLIEYYRSIAPFILPHLRDRPLALLRHPGGINEEGFFQKDMPESTPEWLETVGIKSDGEGRKNRYAMCQNEESLIYLVNLGSIDLHSWTSRKGSLDNPDYMIIDLDPEGVDFDEVIKTALVVKDVLDEAGIDGFCKTSGAAGLHVYVPLGAKYSHDQARELAYLIAVLVNEKLPSTTSIERMPDKRQKKVYIDYLQNGFGKNTAAPYCVRPVKKATVSTPLKWSEIKSGLRPEQFTIRNVLRRLEKTGDLFEGVLGRGVNIKTALDRLQR